MTAPAVTGLAHPAPPACEARGPWRSPGAGSAGHPAPPASVPGRHRAVHPARTPAQSTRIPRTPRTPRTAEETRP